MSLQTIKQGMCVGLTQIHQILTVSRAYVIDQTVPTHCNAVCNRFLDIMNFKLISSRLLVEENALDSALLRHIFKPPLETQLQNIYLRIPQLIFGYVFEYTFLHNGTDCIRDTKTRNGRTGVERGVQNLSILHTINVTEMIRYSVVLLRHLVIVVATLWN